MKYFEQNPHGANPTIRGQLNWDSHVWARETFANQFARGGGALPSMFAPTAGEAFKAPFRKKHKVGSPTHIRNLEKMLARDPNNKGIQKALQKASAGPGKVGTLSRVAGFGLGAAFIALPAFTTEGGIVEKGRAVAIGAASFAGWEGGATLGMALGGAIGSVIPGIGTAIGAVAGYIGGGLLGSMGAESAAGAAFGFADRLVDRERNRRKLDWVGDKTAFQTQRASTMRQQSMEMMNRGMMSARSLLGREGVMLHQ
jgi:hypothetical protein